MLSSASQRVTSVVLMSLSVALCGCPKANQDFEAGRKAEALQDYDTALVAYERAVRANPTDAEFKLRETHVRFEDGEFHFGQGEKALSQGDVQLAFIEFGKAVAIDPSNGAAEQERNKVADLLSKKAAVVAGNSETDDGLDNQKLLEATPALKPLSREPINLKMTNDSRIVFETIAKLAGLSVIFDPDYTSRRISVELPNVTVEQAMEAVSFEAKAFWQPLTSSVIEIAPDNPQKRRDLENEQVGTFYLTNTVTPQDMTEIVTGLRQLLDLRRVQQVNAQNAIVIRDTPDKLDLAGKIISDIDKAKPEVLIHVQVLAADRDRLHDLGILPGQSATLTFNPRCSVQSSSSDCSTSTTSSSSSTSTTQITLNNLKKLSTADYSLTLPGAAAEAVLTDNKTKIIQDPEIRVTDGEKATLKIGERVPVATGSYQTGVGVTSSSSISSLVNTQYQYIDVGVNIEVQPRIHPGGDVSMKLTVEVSSVSGYSSIGGIQEPIISQRKIDHDVRLKDGEVNILGGLIERTETNDLNGIPGGAQIPIMRYLFAQSNKEIQDDEVLIVLTPHILRLPSINADNLRRIAAGTDTNTRVYHEEFQAPGSNVDNTTVAPDARFKASAAPAASTAAELGFEPSTADLKVGDRTTLGVVINNVHDLFSLPILLRYDPAIIQIEEARNGEFLSGGTQAIALVQHIDAEKGEAIISATRQPNSSGVSGNGSLIGIVVRAVSRGTSKIQILQINARDSHQADIPVISREASVSVQ
jgi:general secretion pathway protein D